MCLAPKWKEPDTKDFLQAVSDELDNLNSLIREAYTLLSNSQEEPFRNLARDADQAYRISNAIKRHIKAKFEG